MPNFRSGGTLRGVYFDEGGITRRTTLLSGGGAIIVRNVVAWDEIEGAEAVWRRPRLMWQGLHDPEIRMRYALTFWIGWACTGPVPSGIVGVLGLIQHGHLGYAAAVFAALVCLGIVAVVHWTARADVLSLHFKTSGGLWLLGDFVCARSTAELAGDESAAQAVWDGLLDGLAQHDGVSPATSDPGRWTWRRGTREWAYAPVGWDTSRTFGHHEHGEDKVVLFRSQP